MMPSSRKAGENMDIGGDWARGARIRTRWLAVLGLAVTGVFLGGFGAWASLAPLAGAALAPGVVAAAGQNQTVQHFEGGIVRTIRVKEGERVEVGQVLFDLDGTAAEAQRNRLEKQLVGFVARAARLVAERDGAAAPVFPQSLHERAAAAGVEDLLSEQEREFFARLAVHQGERTIMRKRVQSLSEQIEGMSAQQTALERQLLVVREEAARKAGLLDQGLTNRSEYTSLLRSEAELVGQSGQVVSNILSSRTQITEAEEQFARLGTQRIETAVTQLNEVRAQMSDAEEQLRAAEDVLRRITVRAPSEGVVVKLNVNTVGSVVRPGDPLLELLPTGEDLLIEARISPADVDVVSIGQPARLRFSALNARTTPTVNATVTYLSADRLTDPSTDQPYYTARLRIAGELPPEIELKQVYPGMPVETYIATGERTFAEYLVKPITDSFNRAFREE